MCNNLWERIYREDNSTCSIEIESYVSSQANIAKFNNSLHHVEFWRLKEVMKLRVQCGDSHPWLDMHASQLVNSMMIRNFVCWTIILLTTNMNFRKHVSKHPINEDRIPTMPSSHQPLDPRTRSTLVTFKYIYVNANLQNAYKLFKSYSRLPSRGTNLLNYNVLIWSILTILSYPLIRPLIDM